MKLIDILKLNFLDEYKKEWRVITIGAILIIIVLTMDHMGIW